MKLLFDENLSPKLAKAFEEEYPGSAHVRMLGLRGATDAVHVETGTWVYKESL